VSRFDVTVAPDELVRLATKDMTAEAGDDIDLWVYSITNGDLELFDTSGATPAANEVVDVTEPGQYAVFVHTFDGPVPSISWEFRQWHLAPTDASNVVVTVPPAVAGTTGDVQLDLSALSDSDAWFGAVDFATGGQTVGTTFVTVDRA
jgi:hypothetical protein